MIKSLRLNEHNKDNVFQIVKQINNFYGFTCSTTVYVKCNMKQ